MPAIDHARLCGDLVRLAVDAATEIMRIYRSDFSSEEKDDKSPVTEADGLGEKIILAGLSKLAPDLAVVAEEAASDGHLPDIGDQFFLVDPLDGTKEFIARNGEFTVNIALIEHGTPTVGVVYAPAKKRMFFGYSADGAGKAFEQDIDAEVSSPMASASAPRPIEARLPAKDGMIAVTSRSHRDYKTDEYLEHYHVKDFVTAGSSLKFCLLAAGEADIYPRHGRTMEWDTAAGDGVLRAAGGRVTHLDGKPFVYGKHQDGFANPFFVAWGKKG